jgi:hypothetical protein
MSQRGTDMTKYMSARHGIEIWHDDGITQLLAGAGDPSVVGQVADIGAIYLCSTVSGALYSKSGPGDTDWLINSYSSSASSALYKTYLDLLDTPTTYSGQTGKYARVNAAGDGLEFGYLGWIDPPVYEPGEPLPPLIPETAIQSFSIFALN